MKEVWRDIEGYQGLYQVSSEGRIKSLKREYIHNISKKTTTRKERILKASYNANNYLAVTLYKNGKGTTYTVHRLVALHFIDKPEDWDDVENNTHNGYTINHIDFNKENNHVSNLQWATNAENIEHAVKNGLTGGPKKEIEITKDDITLRFESGVEAAEFIGCRSQSIRNVANPNSREKTIYGWTANYLN